MNIYRRIIILSLVLLTFSGCFKRELYKESRFLLGTVVEVISPYPEAAKIVFEEIERIENIFSSNLKDSAVSHLNRTGYLNTNFEVASLIEKCRVFFGLTEGNFDVSIAPLSKIWKLALDKNSLPDERTIRENLPLVGMNNIHVDRDNNSVKFKKKGMAVEFGGVAKGYAVDVAINELKRKGIDSVLINAGGDIYCLGSKFGQPWKLGLQHPRKKEVIIDAIELKDAAVATSGDYEQFMEIDGKRYSHIINPRTGYPVENDIVSVTVVAKDAVTADIVATCIFLLGKQKGTNIFQNYEGVEKIVIITQSDVSHN